MSGDQVSHEIHEQVQWETPPHERGSAKESTMLNAKSGNTPA